MPCNSLRRPETLIFVILVSLAALFFHDRLAHAQGGSVTISSPRTGEAVQGLVTVIGTSQVPGFKSAEISFAYVDNPTNTWFLINNMDQPVTEAELAQWNTSTLTDGNYTLRLWVSLEDGSELSAFVEGLRVRNYTAIETSTPPPTLQPDLIVSTPDPTSTQTPASTPTLLPPNPATLSLGQVFTGLQRGALFTGGFFVIFLLLLRFRRRR